MWLSFASLFFASFILFGFLGYMLQKAPVHRLNVENESVELVAGDAVVIAIADHRLKRDGPRPKALGP